MPCDPSGINVNAPAGPPFPAFPGFPSPLSVNIDPIFGFEIPDWFPPDLLAMVNQVFALIGGGTLRGDVGEWTVSVRSFIMSILAQLSPYLSLYNFIQPIFAMIQCIIDVLCAIPNVFAVIRALRRLFKECFPAFISIFPQFAILAIIIALMLLLLALILYILEQLLLLILQILANLAILVNAATFESTAAVAAAIRKLAYILCIFEQLFAIFVFLGAIMAVIKALAGLGIDASCFGGDSNTAASPCCEDSVCPPFLKQADEAFEASTGRLVYFFARYDPLLPFVETREETWQFVDPVTREFEIRDIITPIDGSIYWPDPNIFTASSALKRVPYILNFTAVVDPTQYNQVDAGGPRRFEFRDVIVSHRPYIGVRNYQNDLEPPNTGTVRLTGGEVYEEDGSRYVLDDGSPATLTNFIHLPEQGGADQPSDIRQFDDLEYRLRFNYEALASYGLITVGCSPDIRSETNVTNQIREAGAFALGDLPDIAGAQECMQNALSDFRKDISVETTALFQATTEACLEDLRVQVISTYEKALDGAVTSGIQAGSGSTIAVDPDLQFVGLPIAVTVTLLDANGVNVGLGIPDEVIPNVLSDLKLEPDLGAIGPVTYDGYTGAFTADLTSDVAGDGLIGGSYDGYVFAERINGDDPDATTEIVPLLIPFTFVDRAQGGAGDGRTPRRGIDDVPALSGGGRGTD